MEREDQAELPSYSHRGDASVDQVATASTRAALVAGKEQHQVDDVIDLSITTQGNCGQNLFLCGGGSTGRQTLFDRAHHSRLHGRRAHRVDTDSVAAILQR